MAKESLVYDRSLSWLRKQSDQGIGVSATSRVSLPYPEVSGYLIPSLLEWREIELANQYRTWLIDIQHRDGYWTDPTGDSPYFFDTGQVVRGLLAFQLRDSSQEVEDSILRAVDWASGLISPTGVLNAPDMELWPKDVPSQIQLYALEPLHRAALYLDKTDVASKFQVAINKIISETDFEKIDALTHFHAYIVEALVDLGRVEIATSMMDAVDAQMNRRGLIPGRRNAQWTCSTGVLQYSVIWYKLGESEKGLRSLSAAERLQNRSGGWFGSYGALKWVSLLASRIDSRFGWYFPRDEIPWAAKYFLDALRLKLGATFVEEAETFLDTIARDDGRLQFVAEHCKGIPPARVLEIGCGKGRYLEKLRELAPTHEYFGLDISPDVLRFVPAGIQTIEASMLNTTLAPDSIDVILYIEAIEHAVNVPGALAEAFRVLRPGGKIVIIDKNSAKLNSPVFRLRRLRPASWERWFNDVEMSAILKSELFESIETSLVPYEGRNDGLFIAWVARKPC